MAVKVSFNDKYKSSLIRMDDGSLRCTIDSLGLVIYAKTQEEVKGALGDAVMLLMRDLNSRGGRDAVTERLDRAGIEFYMEEQDLDQQMTANLEQALGKVLEPA